MRRLIFATLLLAATFATASAQDNASPSSNANDIPNMGRAPKQTDGVGRLDLRVVDEDGNPVKGVRADLQSHRSDGFLCESWNWTDERGVSVLPPLHMGKLKLKLSAKGYATQKIEINAADLDQPVRVVLHKK
ncbi:MAG TPA: carboxypeptidase-like regulatory domain-containing protein [Pyrinomonadaceae bacterium]|nr:carboxypeptidase-like regulatory domain-containing protein [Pyrinomonadaceae bacterium]